MPQGAIPSDTKLAVRLTPLAASTPAIAGEVTADCVVNCVDATAAGWQSVGGVASPVSGSGTVEMTGGPWAVQVFLNAEVCGGTIGWNIDGGDMAEGTDFQAAPSGAVLLLFGQMGCEPPYAGDIVVQPTLNYADFCDPVTLHFSGEGGGCGGGEIYCGEFQLVFASGWDGPFYNTSLGYSWQPTSPLQFPNYGDPFSSAPGNYQIQILPLGDMGTTDPNDIDWVITDNGATTDFALALWGPVGTIENGWGFTLTNADSANEFRAFTGHVFTLKAFVAGAEVPVCEPLTILEIDTPYFPP